MFLRGAVGIVVLVMKQQVESHAGRDRKKTKQQRTDPEA